MSADAPIAVLTGGGDCPGLNAVIRAVVKTAVNVYDWPVLGIQDGYEGLIQPGRIGPLTPGDVRGILPRGGTILGTSNRANPFAYPVANAQGRLEDLDLSQDVIRHMRVLGLRAVIAIGGDGTMHIAKKLFKLGAPMVGVPKTIDNDLWGTDVTFGFDTALDTATQALDRLHTTAESHHRIMVVEVMGRHAGWIALSAGIAGGADVILIPEIPYDIQRAAAHIMAREGRGAKFSIVVAAEGAFPRQGRPVYEAPPGDVSKGQLGRLGGIGQVVAEELGQLCGKEARVTVLGHVQRGGSPSASDRILSSRFGSQAVHLVAEGLIGHMVALRGESVVSLPIAEAVSRPKLVPLDGDLVRTARGLGLCLGD